MTTTDTTPAPLTPEREAEIRQTHPGDWYAGPWYSEYIDGQADEPAYYRVVHQESGTVLATLPDWAGPLAAFTADAHDAGPELLDEVKRLRNELTIERIWHRQAARLAELLHQERDEARARVAELEQQVAEAPGGTR